MPRASPAARRHGLPGPRRLGSQPARLRAGDRQAPAEVGVGTSGRAPPIHPAGFEKLPKRRIGERTFASRGHKRRLAKDGERLCTTGETGICLAMSPLIAKRLACNSLNDPNTL